MCVYGIFGKLHFGPGNAAFVLKVQSSGLGGFGFRAFKAQSQDL